MKKDVVKILKKTLKELDVKKSDEEIENLLEIPPTIDFGDYAFPCFVLAKELKKSPHAIALELREKIGNLPQGIPEINTQGGYLNFFMDRVEFSKTLINEILNQKDKFGKRNIGNKQKALIEHTSINPNASPHVGRARNALIGDSLVRIFKFFNYKPEVHYYVNDVSKQIAMLVLAGADKSNFNEMLNEYVKISKKIKKSPNLEKELFKILNSFEKGDKKIKNKFKKITETCVKGQIKILSKLGINYDYFDYESDYTKNNSDILEKFNESKKLFQDKDGRKVLNLQGTPIENKMKSPVLVLTRSDGTGLYPLRDISYTLYKLGRAEKNILVLGEDQKLYFEQIKQALSFIGSKSPEVIHYSYILLSEKGKSKKMSTRKGDVVLLEDFLEKAIKKAEKEIKKRKTKGDAKKVGIGAVKYAILKNNNNKIIHFNLDDALNFEGDTGPYLLYSYARANSILKKIKTKKKAEVEIKLENPEISLVKKLSEFPEIAFNAYNTLNPSLIANYSYQLAQIFNEFYHECPVIGSNQEKFRISLVESFKYVLENSLNLLGITVLDRM